VALLILCAIVAFLKWRYVGPVPVRPGVAPDARAELATWPWEGARQDTPHRGVTHFLARSADGTVVDLLEFDFEANPSLRLELYDQDEDDAKPFDNEVAFWQRAVGQATAHLNASGRGTVVAAWNGLFFAADRSGSGPRIARHVAPVVLRGKVYYNVGNHRWTFGVSYRDGAPRFSALHLPGRQALSESFDYAAAGAQCLALNGAALKLQPFPRPGDAPLPRPVPCAPDEAGHIPGVDHIRTSRTSMGWSEDSRRFYLLVAKEPDSEAGSSIALKRDLPVAGGWTVADLQAFWVRKGVYGAVNIDGGDVTQMVYLRGDGQYEMVPARWATAKQRMTLPPTLEGAPQGGTLMYFHVRDTDAGQSE